MFRTAGRRRRPPRSSAMRWRPRAKRCAPPASSPTEIFREPSRPTRASAMPIATVRGVAINYDIIGTRGLGLALTPGGRNPLANVRAMAERMAAAGFRVLIHDRRNCGASDVAFDPTGSEYD